MLPKHHTHLNQCTKPFWYGINRKQNKTKKFWCFQFNVPCHKEHNTHSWEVRYTGTRRLTVIFFYVRVGDEEKTKKKTKILKRIINLSPVKTAITVVLQVKERIGKVRVKIVAKRIMSDHKIYISSWTPITIKVHHICRDVSFKIVLISQWFNEDNCHGVHGKLIFWLRFLIPPSHKMAGAAIHFPANSIKTTKGLLCKLKSRCWESSPNSHLTQHILPLYPPPQRAVLGVGLLLVHTIPWQWGGTSFHDVYSHKHPGHGQCGDTLMLANDILLPDGLLGCHTGAVKKQERAMSVSQHHSALNWHLHASELKDDGKGYS